MKKLTTLFSIALSMGMVVLGLGQVNAQTMCTAQYDPVCGVNGTTYGNACMAQGAEIAYQGECKTTDTGATNTTKACTREYAPVCGVDGKTYGNACTAQDVKIAYEGVCKNTPTNNDIVCDMDYTPVCGVDGKTYGNACMAQDVKINYTGECTSDMNDDTANACTLEYMPVCGSLEVQCIRAPCPPIKQVYSNACLAKAAGATIVADKECKDMMVGNDKDKNGCIGSAGYQWDDTKKECVRPREQDGNITLANKILWAHERGITKYTTVGTFMPEQILTREQAAKMLVAAIQSQPNLDIPLKEMYCVFADQASIDPTLSDQVNIACQYGLFQGYKGNFMPTMFMNDVDTMTILGRVATHSPAINMYLATSQFATPTYKPMTRAMFVDRLFTMSTYIDQYATQDNMTMLNNAQSDLDNARDMWTDKKLTTYTMVQTKSCFCMEEYTRSIMYNVINGVVAKGAMYEDDMMMVNMDKSPELHTVEQAYAMIQEAIDAKVEGLTVEYDATRGYPINISIDRSKMIADEEQNYTFMITNTNKDSIMNGMNVDANLMGMYHLVSYDNTGTTNTGITLQIGSTRISAKICNNLNSDFSVSGNMMTFGNMISTMMYCDDQMLMNMETSFASMTGATYTMSGTMLTISSNNHMWKFQKNVAPMTKLVGTYVLQSYDGVANTDTGITMIFDNNMVNAQICNNISSNVTATDTVVTFDMMAATKMMCANVTLSNMETSFTMMTNAEYTKSGTTLTMTQNGHTWVWMMK